MLWYTYRGHGLNLILTCIIVEKKKSKNSLSQSRVRNISAIIIVDRKCLLVNGLSDCNISRKKYFYFPSRNCCAIASARNPRGLETNLPDQRGIYASCFGSSRWFYYGFFGFRTDLLHFRKYYFVTGPLTGKFD